MTRGDLPLHCEEEDVAGKKKKKSVGTTWDIFISSKLSGSCGYHFPNTALDNLRVDKLRDDASFEKIASVHLDFNGAARVTEVLSKKGANTRLLLQQAGL